MRQQGNHFMNRALTLAAEAGARGEVPVAAIVVGPDGERILAEAANRVETDKDPTAHAEILAIRAACRYLHDMSPSGGTGGRHLAGCDLYVTLEPCPMCAQAISFARIRRLYFAAWDPKGGAIDHGPNLYQQASCHHQPEVYGGIGEKAGAEILRDFFLQKR